MASIPSNLEVMSIFAEEKPSECHRIDLRMLSVIFIVWGNGEQSISPSAASRYDWHGSFRLTAFIFLAFDPGAEWPLFTARS